MKYVAGEWELLLAMQISVVTYIGQVVWVGFWVGLASRLHCLVPGILAIV